MIEDYDFYKLSILEKIFCFGKGYLIIFAISYLTYRCTILSIIISNFGIFYVKIYRKKVIETRKNQLILQFKEFLYSLLISLSAGYSTENAIGNTITDLKILYPSGSYIVSEISNIKKKIDFGISSEKAMWEFAEKTKVPDIENFCEAYAISYKMGGNFIENIKSAGNLIIDKINVNEEIKIVVSEKMLELKVLRVFPFIILGGLNYFCFDFIEIIYTTMIGRIAITVAMMIIFLGIYIGNVMCSKRF